MRKKIRDLKNFIRWIIKNIKNITFSFLHIVVIAIWVHATWTFVRALYLSNPLVLIQLVDKFYSVLHLTPPPIPKSVLDAAVDNSGLFNRGPLNIAPTTKFLESISKIVKQEGIFSTPLQNKPGYECFYPGTMYYNKTMTMFYLAETNRLDPSTKETILRVRHATDVYNKHVHFAGDVYIIIGEKKDLEKIIERSIEPDLSKLMRDKKITSAVANTFIQSKGNFRDFIIKNCYIENHNDLASYFIRHWENVYRLPRKWEIWWPEELQESTRLKKKAND